LSFSVEKPFLQYITAQSNGTVDAINSVHMHTPIIMMMEVTDKGRACIPEGLTKA